MPGYERHSITTLEVGLALIEKHRHLPTKPKIREHVNGVAVTVTSLRLRTFLLKGTRCSCCGLEGQFFALERSLMSEKAKEQYARKHGTPYPNQPYHLNLYGFNPYLGEEVLFTHDHTLARSLGGADDLSNTTTMCGPCNWRKGQVEGTLAKYVQKERD